MNRRTFFRSVLGLTLAVPVVANAARPKPRTILPLPMTTLPPGWKLVQVEKKDGHYYLWVTT